MSVKQYIPAIKYGNAVTSDEVDLSGATGDVTFTAGSPSAGTQSVTALNPAIGQTITVAVSSAQILAMSAAPVSIIPAPGSGKLIVVDSVVFEMIPTTTSYTSGGVVSLNYSGTSTTLVGTMPAVNVTTGTAGVANPYILVAAANTSQTAPPLANTAVVLTNITAGFATGTGTAKVIANYQIITL